MRTRNLEIPRCAIAHLRSGPSDHPRMTACTIVRRFAPRNDKRQGLTQHDPRRRVVAGAFLASYLAVDAGLDQARRDGRAQEQMIEPQSGVTRPAVSLVIPERVHRV